MIREWLPCCLSLRFWTLCVFLVTSICCPPLLAGTRNYEAGRWGEIRRCCRDAERGGDSCLLRGHMKWLGDLVEDQHEGEGDVDQKLAFELFHYIKFQVLKQRDERRDLEAPSGLGGTPERCEVLAPGLEHQKRRFRSLVERSSAYEAVLLTNYRRSLHHLVQDTASNQGEVCRDIEIIQRELGDSQVRMLRRSGFPNCSKLFPVTSVSWSWMSGGRPTGSESDQLWVWGWIDRLQSLKVLHGDRHVSNLVTRTLLRRVVDLLEGGDGDHR